MRKLNEDNGVVLHVGMPLGTSASVNIIGIVASLPRCAKVPRGCATVPTLPAPGSGLLKFSGLSHLYFLISCHFLQAF